MLASFPHASQEAKLFRLASSNPSCFPRRFRTNPHGNDLCRLLRFLRKEADDRAFRLLDSIHHLEIEVKASYERSAYSATRSGNQNSGMEIVYHTLKQRLWDSLRHARGVPVDDDALTIEFRLARHMDPRENGFCWPQTWWDYEELRQSRHSWGEFLRSDDDWHRHAKLSRSLKILFKAKRVKNSSDPRNILSTSSRTLISTDAFDIHTESCEAGDAPVLSIECLMDSLPREIIIILRERDTGKSIHKVVPINSHQSVLRSSK